MATLVLSDLPVSSPTDAITTRSTSTNKGSEEEATPKEGTNGAVSPVSLPFTWLVYLSFCVLIYGTLHVNY